MPVMAAVVSVCEHGTNGKINGLAFDRAHDSIPQLRDVVNPLERLVQIMHANDRLMDELASIRSRIVRARNYLESPGSNERFAAENLAFCKSKHRGVLAQLRANRIEAYRILGLGGEKVDS